MTIRPAAPADVRAVYALMAVLEGHALPEEAFDRVYAHNLTQPGIRYWVAEAEGRVAGFISLHMECQLHHATLVGEIQELVLHEDCRGQGWGAALLRHACLAAREAGCSHLELNTNIRRTRAQAFYQREGWAKEHYNLTYKHWAEEV